MSPHRKQNNERVDAIKPNLPKYYGVMVQSKYHDIDVALLHNVVAKRTVNERYLKILEIEFGEVKK